MTTSYAIGKPVDSLPSNSRNTYITGSKYDPIFQALLNVPPDKYLPVKCANPKEATKTMSSLRSLSCGVRRRKQLGLAVDERTGHVDGLCLYRDGFTIFIQLETPMESRQGRMGK